MKYAKKAFKKKEICFFLGNTNLLSYAELTFIINKTFLAIKDLFDNQIS